MERVTRASFFRQLWNTDDGSGIAEFAVAVAVLAVLFLGIMEFGLAAWQRNSVASDVREGARYAAVRGTTSGRTATADSVIKYVKTRTSLDSAGLRVYGVWDAEKQPAALVKLPIPHNVTRP